MYIDAMVAPVKPGRKEDYATLCREQGQLFLDYGALEIVECYGDADVPEGKQTDLWRAVGADKAAGEGVAFCWIIWQSKEAHDTAWQALEKDDRMRPDPEGPMDGRRMIFGGFEPLFEGGHR